MRSLKICLVLLLIMLALIPLTGTAQVPGSRNLRQGDRGDDVSEVQRRLSRWGYFNGPVNGVFGPQTLVAIRLFQQRNGLPVTGIVAERTFAALGITIRSVQQAQVNKTAAVTPVNSVSPNDRHLLARAVYSEARGEPFEGQVAVAAVILNRVRSPIFPTTISGVIFQPLAFTAVADGQFYLTPNEEAYRAAQLAVNGWDPSGGALYYFNPQTATSAWIWSRPYIKSIGRHRFCR
ncbi:MAG: N-acetylmuramoyl-L-alanine amidase [Bacillota bacterium]|nr:MAG: N-acetylmuramoyl-L-alanine amidase [Bacillota bacterium]MBS3949756.1 spore cortex-lytic enzyme [Peptococcaceae bacterium]